MARRDTSQDLISIDECSQAITHALDYVKEKLDAADQNLLKGLIKFEERVTKMPTSKLATSFHSFGTQAVFNTCLTTTSVVKKRKQGENSCPTRICQEAKGSKWFKGIPEQRTKLQKQSLPERAWKTQTFASVCRECEKE